MEQYLSQASPEQKDRLLNDLEGMQMVETQRMYNRLANHCFTSCVQDFRSVELSPDEDTCVKNCSDKWMSSYGRVGQRFAEQNMAQQMHGQQQ